MNKWIAWHGLEDKAPTNKKVHVVFRNGEDSTRAFPNGSCLWRWNWDFVHGDIVSYKLAEDDKEASQPIKSDGGSSDYYKLTIINKAGESIQCETGDVFRAMVGNDFDLSNILKAARRMYEASQGRGKEGATIEYDANKIIYFANEYKHWHKQC